MLLIGDSTNGTNIWGFVALDSSTTDNTNE